MKYFCCGELDDFMVMYGGIKIRVGRPQSLEGMDDYKGDVQLAENVWDFRYCPFCGEELRDK